MNKYTCFFINQNIEDIYQKNHQMSQRISQFKLFSYTVTIGLVIKISMMINQGIIDKIYPHIAMLITLTIYNLIKFESSQKIRMAQISINTLFTLYVLQYEVFTDIIAQNYNGGNQMAANILNSIMGEFPEAAFGTLVALAMRLYYFVSYGELKNINVMAINASIHFVWIYYLYNFNKAKRSQFILTLVDNKWEKIFQQIFHNNKKFVLLHYDEEEFKIKKVLQTILPQSTSLQAFLEYIREVKCNNQPIQNFFFQQINKHKKNQQDVINQQILLKYERKLIQFHFSLFFGDKPIILLVNEDQTKSSIDVISQSTVILKILKNLVNIIDSNKQYNKRKFFQLSQFIKIKYLIGKINSRKKSIQKINLNNFVNKIANRYKRYIIVQTYGMQCEVMILEDVFHLFLLVVFGNTSKKNIQAQIFRDFDCKVHLVFEGYFRQDIINIHYQKFQFYFALIISNCSIQENCIKIELNEEVLYPFTNNQHKIS
ncbi:unnamed protein product (macronuclear) [Paramecium tetraurelia]|uniref:Transmembrane protein n=1 Tax=Paramecium tetraurelia TaxID=5888 RepID=A0EBQ3_PARTE|nr:uncharacterized protein GSPATT00025454001 [Paramecium tetraurelia]CAK92720.1 unnamed protein product [Paramecium tetraurelia]|eukprot:XP_001460117.1 hypothetical protein (macronuclear) [Paramecium tetraurelia strain d4-2]